MSLPCRLPVVVLAQMMLNLFLDGSEVEKSFGGVRGVFDNVDGPAGAVFFVDVLNDLVNANDFVCCPHHRPARPYSQRCCNCHTKK